jgi:cytochrome c
MRLYSPALIAAALAFSSAAAQAQDLAAGEQSFKKCLPCHAIGEGATHKVGPQLNGIEGRKAGTIEGYSYSEANKTSDLVWSEAVFKQYIKNPMGQMPGTKMAFPGIRNETEINNLWAYLKQFGPDGKIK